MRARTERRALLALACALTWTTIGQGRESTSEASAEGASVFIVEEGAPPGFENLDVPQRTLIDVSYGGRDLPVASATYTDTTIRFDDPEAIVREIEDLLYPERVVEALSGRLDAHVERACLEPGVPAGCGLLEPEEAGVIFDANRFHVEIFVNRSLLRLAKINEAQRLPPPSDEWTGLATLGGSLSGTAERDTNYSFRASTLLAKGRTHLDFQSDVQTGGNYIVDRLTLHHDRDDWQYSAGLFRSTPFRVIGETELVGLRARSSLKTRTRLYLDRAYGSRLRVFLQRRSLVQVFRDGRLLVGGIYDVGNQELDTSELPSGAYEVEIRIQDPVSGERRERQFFAKTDDLPPLGQIHFNVEAGFLRDRRDPSVPLDVSGAPLVRFSSAVRTSKRFGLDFDMALIDEETLFTAGALWLGRHTIVRAGPLVTSRGAAGSDFFGAYERGPFFANANLRGVWGESGSRFLRIPSADFTYSTAYTWRNVRFAIRGDVRERAVDREPRFSITPSIGIPLLRRSRFRGDLRIEYTHGDQGNVFFARIDLVEWLDDFQFSQSATGRYEDTRGGPRGIAEADLRARWRSPATLPADVQTDLRLTRRRDRTAAGVNADVRTHRGAANGFVEYSVYDRNRKPETFYGTQFSIGVVGDREGVDALGDSAGTSAILVEVGGDYEGGVFEVFVDEGRVANARVGQPTLVPLPPYAEYRVRIASTGGQSVTYDSKARRVVLYPGTSARLRWEIQRVFVLIAAVVWPDGTPVANGVAYGGVEIATTDESGFLQADVAGAGRLRIEDPVRGETCWIDIPENPAKDDFVVLDEILCLPPEALASAPAPPDPGLAAAASGR
ncbi:MAG: TcfC E-set like domain-containing protein [Myxococcota bacterium]